MCPEKSIKKIKADAGTCRWQILRINVMKRSEEL